MTKPEGKIKRLAVFDWNGTLFDDIEATHIATNACLDFFGKPPITREIEQENFTFPLIHFYEKMGVPANEYLEKAEEAGHVFIETYNYNKAECGLAKNTIEILKWLNDQDVTCIILSNLLQPVLNDDVKHFEIGEYFHTVSGNEDPATIVQGLSKQKRLEEFFKRENFLPENSFIIGDSHEEAEIAHRLNMMGISISGGLLSASCLEKYKKDYVINCLTELPDILIKEWNLNPFQ
ncbi:MAG: HAD hydrolase-like protein [Pseudomonadota bacterium]